MAKYSSSDVSVLKLDRERIQAHPHLYIPDNRLAGAVHLVREIVDNADDEMMVPDNKTNDAIIIKFDETKREVSVSDKGRGIPHESLKDLCEILHSSAKFNKGDKSSYKFASGQHGVGTKLANNLSDYFIIETIRDGKSTKLKYEDGVLVDEILSKAPKSEHGTNVTFSPSSKYLKDLNKLKCKHIEKMLEEKSDACPGIFKKFIGIKADGTKVTKKYSGLTTEELLTKYNNITSKIYEFEDETELIKDNMIKLRLAFGYDAKETDGCNVMAWTNYIYNRNGGTHVDGFITALFDFFRKYMISNYFSEKDKKNLTIKKEDIKLGLCSVIVLLMEKPDYLGQYKEELTTQELEGYMIKLLRKKLSKLPDSELKNICSIIKDNIKARMSSQRARAQVKKIGNGLSRDKIDNYIPSPLTCSTKYRELYIVEGKSAGSQVANAKYEFQEVLKLRGKVNNIFDMSVTDYSKLQVVDEISRILGVPPGLRKGDIKSDRVLGLTDADADGRAIRTGIIVIFAKAFPQVIEQGKLFMVEPPLYSFKENGKKIFVSTNREYVKYLQNKFCEDNTVYFKDKKMDNDALLEFLVRNERYIEYLKKLSNNNTCSEYLMELIMSNIGNIGISKNSVDEWNKLIKSNFSKQLESYWDDDRIIVEGIKNGTYEMVEINEDLITCEKSSKVLSLIDMNMGNISGYSIKGRYEKNELTLFQLLNIFYKYKGDNVHRFKGLGEMNPHDLRSTCMDISKQRTIKVKWKDVDKALRDLAWLHSNKGDSLLKRKEFMKSYIPDITEIDT